MKRNMRNWVQEQISGISSRPLPLLSFPCVQLMGVTVKELVSSSSLQAQGMKLVADRVPSAATVSLMDLSVEAEAFGSSIHIGNDEVPTVVGAIVSDEEAAASLQIPQEGTGRTQLYLDAIEKALLQITDRPVFAGVIGPYSLAGRLMDVSKAMIYCYEDPAMIHMIMEKVTAFLIAYCNAYREIGANGVILAEPLAGLLSPGLAAEFSHPYVKQIVDAVQCEDFCVIYHNCGNNVPLMAKEIYEIGAMGYHFGDAIDLSSMLPDAPADVLVMGNVSPSAQFLGGTPDSITAETLRIMENRHHSANFLISSGWDIPPRSSWANFEAFFRAAASFSERH